MQSKTSFFNLALFKKNISRTWIVGLLYFVVLLIFMPISMVISLSNFDQSWYVDSGYTKSLLMIENFSTTWVAEWGFVVSMVVAAITFWYLFSKRDNYMMHAFPVSRTSLYFTGIISSSIIALVPVILNAVILTIVAAAEHAYIFDVIWYFTFGVCVSTILFLSIAMFSLMASGQIVPGIVFYIIFNVLYLLMDVAFRITSGILLFGMTEATSYRKASVFTPVEFITNNCGVVLNKYYDNVGNVKSYTYTMGGAGYLIAYLVAAVVIFAITYFIYKAKKLETVQDFIAVPFLKPVFTIGMSFFISMVAGALIAGMVDAVKVQMYSVRFAIAIVAALIIGAIVFYASIMLIEKTVRVFSGKTFSFFLGYSALALVILIGMRCDVLKIENKVPKAQDIAWVGISSSYTMVFTDEEEIQSIRELHKNFIDDKKELRDVSVLYKDLPGSYLTFKYKLNNGKVIARTYEVVDTESELVSATYLAATEPILDYLNNPSRIKQHVIGNIWDNCDVTEMSFSTYTYDKEHNDFFSNNETFDYLTDKEKQEKFGKVYEAFLKDIDEGSVYTTSFGLKDYYGRDSEYLYNDFNFTVFNKNIPYFSDEQRFWEWDDDSQYYQNIYAQMTRQCVNTLKALKDEGFYTDESQIITYKEYSDTVGDSEGGYIY
ncbi:MAG: hypothetical protein K5883_00170 [Pseudobutyrivibrio sp.]|nr:hypothetical protein [Pseudobutyrivibrio sp.]